MIIKKIVLDNIRSYEHQEVEFPEGSTLLAGDIGSGKTSILLAIEFALFGLQPGRKGNSLLRNGKNEGGVRIEFNVEGKEIIIERTLKKGKTISQDACSITIDGEKKELSVTELKDKVLDILNYPKEFSKKQNLLYKFTVYTPQEEMKQIILEDSETRINTLRHVFGIDKYKQILENTSVVISGLREERKIAEGATLTLEQDKTDLITKEEELEGKRHGLVSLERELFEKKEIKKRIEEEMEEVSKKMEEKIKLQQEVEKTKIMISGKNETISDNVRTSKMIAEQIKESGEIKIDDSKITNLSNEIELIKKEEKILDEKNLQITSEISSLTYKSQEDETIKKNISHLDICPTCLQDVDAVYKSNVFNKMDNDISGNIRRIQSLRIEKESIVKKINALDFEVSLKQKEIQETNLLMVKQAGIKEKQKRLEEIEKLNLTLEKDVELLEQHMSILKNSVFELSRFDLIYEEKEKNWEIAVKEERMADIKVAELKREIDLFSKQIEELRLRIIKVEEQKKRLNYLLNLESWLSDRFLSVVTFIEKNVMIRLKTEFSKFFSEWFGMLVSESFDVRLQDDFTPIIEQQDYELDYDYLSGGERTAVALAYRLALNQVINSLLSKIKTKDLVILDEPTDGFSAPQLDKMRDVLQELNVKQLIIVSHEQKIEGFVENIVRFKKEKGISGRY